MYYVLYNFSLYFNKIHYNLLISIVTQQYLMTQCSFTKWQFYFQLFRFIISYIVVNLQPRVCTLTRNLVIPVFTVPQPPTLWTMCRGKEQWLLCCTEAYVTMHPSLSKRLGLASLRTSNASPAHQILPILLMLCSSLSNIFIILPLPSIESL